MRTETVICDTCGKDITYTGNSVDYRLVVASQALGTNPEYAVVTDMMIYPPVKRDYYFCNLRCLRGCEAIVGSPAPPAIALLADFADAVTDRRQDGTFRDDKIQAVLLRLDALCGDER